jgi:hypothetical protein
MSLQKIVQPPIGEVIEEDPRLPIGEVLAEQSAFAKHPPMTGTSHPKSFHTDVVVLPAPAKRFTVRWVDLTAYVLTAVLAALGVLALLGEAWAVWVMLAVAWVGAALVVGVSVGRVIRARDGEVAR